jgi:uncharacterized protein (UPF0276 family)
MPIPMGFVLQPDAAHLRLSKPLLDRADYLELAPETMWRPGPEGVLVPNDFADLFFDALDGRMCVAHGVGISLGEPGVAACPRRRRWLDAMRRDHARFEFAWWTDHFGATSLAGENITLPVPIPHSALVHVQSTLDAMATVVPDVGVENSALYFTFGEPGAEVFTLREVSKGPHRWLLLDLHNLIVNAHAQGFDARAYLAALDLSRVIEIHLAGGKPSDPRWLASGRSFQLDGHDEDIPEEVWTLLEEVLPRCTNLRGVTHERMEGTLLDDRDVMRVAEELDRLRGVLQSAERHARAVWPSPMQPHVDEVPYTDAFLQSYVAQLRGARGALVGAASRDALELSALLIAKLRFERTQRGHPELVRFFDEDPRGFTEAFRAFHASTPMHAYGQNEEAEAFLRFVVSRRG